MSDRRQAVFAVLAGLALGLIAFRFLILPRLAS